MSYTCSQQRWGTTEYTAHRNNIHNRKQVKTRLKIVKYNINILQIGGEWSGGGNKRVFECLLNNVNQIVVVVVVT